MSLVIANKSMTAISEADPVKSLSGPSLSIEFHLQLFSSWNGWKQIPVTNANL